MGNGKINIVIFCPICGGKNSKQMSPQMLYWSNIQTFKCCDATVRGAMINEKPAYGRALFKIGAFQIEGNRDRTKIIYKGSLQDTWIDVRHFVGLSESVLLKMFLNGKWEPLIKVSILK